MPTKFRGPALDVCPQCGKAKKSYPQHWNRSADCDYPPITSDDLHQIVRGILLSDGSLEGDKRAKLRVQTISKPLAEWLYDQLGDLAGGLRKHRKEPPNSDVYRVSSLAHTDLNQYREWYDGSQKRIPDSDCLNEVGMTIFYALDGSLTWGHERQRPRITFKAVDDDYRRDLVAMLRAYNSKLTVTQASDHVALSAGDTDGFLDSLMGPVPGVAHKWATNRIEYQTLRQSPADQQEYKTQICITALETAAEQTSGEITPERFDEQIVVVDSATVMETLGGGSWESALRVAGLSLTRDTKSEGQAQPPQKTTLESHERKPNGGTFTREEFITALQKAADDRGEPLTLREYGAWVTEKWVDENDQYPADQTVKKSFGTWSAACEAANVQPGQHKGSETTLDDMIDEVRRICEEVGEWPTSECYRNEKNPGQPSVSWLYKYEPDGVSGWQELIERAKEE